MLDQTVETGKPRGPRRKTNERQVWTKVLVDAAFVQQKLASVLKREDLSKYVL